MVLEPEDDVDYDILEPSSEMFSGLSTDLLQYVRDYCYVKAGSVVHELGSALSSPFFDKLDVSWEELNWNDETHIVSVLEASKDHLEKFYFEGF